MANRMHFPAAGFVERKRTRTTPQKPPPIMEATATPIIFPQYCAGHPKRYAIGEAMLPQNRCFSANEGYGQLWDISPIICIIIPVIQCRA
ncbi:hypothetical protein KCP73_07725 [Salmonella enterica subsp. enterica]|nr:hypothetical protein KCP73_07725 [Salmonella enterica subsp. enterica]